MEEEKPSVEIADIGIVNSHDHLCLLYQEETEVLNLVLHFIQKGVAIGERCVYLNAAQQKLERLLQNVVEVQKQDSGALVLLPVKQTWLRGGTFRQERVLELLRNICAGAAAEGFSGTRIICDMAWAVKDAKSLELLNRFERDLTSFAAEHDTALLCLYDRRLFSPELLLELARIHPGVVSGGRVCGNPLFIPPGAQPRKKAAVCELDVFLAASQRITMVEAETERLKQELEQAYAALARKIYENWQEEDTLRASEQEIHEKDEALLANRRRLQTILQHLPAVMMAFDNADRLAACNHEFERVTGYRGEEVMGKPMLELLQVDGALREDVVSAHPPQGGDYRGREWNLRCRDGSPKLISWSNISRYVPITGWVNWIIGLDVTPRVQAENGLRALKGELEARTAELEAIGQAVSQDLGARLARISGDCGRLQKLNKSQLDPPCRELLEDIGAAARELSGAVAALERMTALTAAELQPVEVDLSAMASEIAAQLSDHAQRPVDFRIEDGVTVTGDKDMLRLAMEQLLENAWHCTIGVKHPVIKFGTAQVEGERSCYVSDNGPRLSASLCEATGGGSGPEGSCRGIGFATVQRIINLHRGRIWSAEQAGKGGTLYFQV
ncbi:MEDS domain-containing protein [Geomonas nitrogeniifigens]|uniref:histidine kinase n=1 Tax=Geomonas diazotrophica TaxID=2843197 RepID=A0ABX8JMB9_9BACT|nr:MEDS domain-containing protein [Geomonas nitrogeniifigens]QWV98512.1 MEDS domain-containing protein [Geomonas nitrogeniifigens]